MHRGRCCILLQMMIGAALGCARDANLATVYGTVRLDGEPLASGTVRFVPVAGRAANGEIQPNGTFSLGMNDGSEFDVLLSRYFDGTLSPSELAELEAKLLADEAFAEHVSSWCLVHRQIIELLTETRLHDLLDQFVQGTPGLPGRAFRQTTS